MEYSYLFGPVPSRRFGRSLGVDLLKSKTCSFDCPFCEVRATEALTATRREYVPTQAVLNELDHWHQSGGRADYITLAGSGEPTLHSRIGEIACHIRNHIPGRLAVLTNSTHLHLREVREALRPMHVVKASFSAWDEASYDAMNKPAPGITLDHIIDGIRRCREELNSELWIEVFLMAGINDGPEALANMAAIVNSFRADRIHINTVHRPPAYPSAHAVDEAVVLAALDYFAPRAEPASSFSRPPVLPAVATTEAIQQMVRRRPCTAADIVGGLMADSAQVAQQLEQMVSDGLIETRQHADAVYYSGKTRRGSRTSAA